MTARAEAREHAKGTGAGADAPAPLLCVEGLVKRFGPHMALDGVELRADCGLTVLTGMNGAGKTTLLRCVAGVLGPTTGSVVVDGVPMRERPMQARRRLGFVPDGVLFPQELRVREFLLHVARSKGLRGAAAHEACQKVAERCGLGEVLHRIAANLSTGYRRRVLLAQGMIATPRVLLLDEPTAGLDPQTRDDVLTLLTDYAANACVLLSTHHVEDVVVRGGRVVSMVAGRIVEG